MQDMSNASCCLVYRVSACAYESLAVYKCKIKGTCNCSLKGRPTGVFTDPVGNQGKVAGQVMALLAKRCRGFAEPDVACHVMLQ